MPDIRVDSIAIAKRDPSLDRMRSYHLEAGTDWFGAWLVDVVYGRIGASGRRIRYGMENKDEAWKLVRRSKHGAINPPG